MQRTHRVRRTNVELDLAIQKDFERLQKRLLKVARQDNPIRGAIASPLGRLLFAAGYQMASKRFARECEE